MVYCLCYSKPMGGLFKYPYRQIYHSCSDETDKTFSNIHYSTTNKKVSKNLLVKIIVLQNFNEITDSIPKWQWSLYSPHLLRLAGCQSAVTYMNTFDHYRATKHSKVFRGLFLNNFCELQLHRCFLIWIFYFMQLHKIAIAQYIKIITAIIH